MSILGSLLRQAIPLRSRSKKTPLGTTISPDYVLLNRRLHAERPEYGTSGQRWAPTVLELARQSGATEVLDYGCGKQTLKSALAGSDLTVIGFDPAIPGLDAPPKPCDLVVCTDVLEHVEPPFIDNVLDDLARCTRRLALVTVATRPALKTLADGRNAHLSVHPLAWWKSHFELRFQVLEVREIEGHEFILFLRALSEVQPQSDGTLPRLDASAPSVDLEKNRLDQSPSSSTNAQTALQHKGLRILFNTPNSMTNWRVQSFFQKEPDTVRWLESMEDGAVLVDVGANVGMYTLFAAASKRCRVFAFEPESQNYALLNQNIASNNLSDLVAAYPLALSDETAASSLFLSEFSAGGSCHSFGKEVGFDLKPRNHAFAQGSFSVTLDSLVKQGSIPVPHYIKIDVDGFEHKVIQGAQETLRNPTVRELLIELNTHLPEHRAVFKWLGALGFTHDPAQARGALRKSGTFEGVGEVIFKRSASPAAAIDFGRVSKLLPPRAFGEWQVLKHVLDRISRAEIISDPFPYLIVDDVFPSDYYEQALAHFPTGESLLPINRSGRVNAEDYKERHVVLFNDEEFSRLNGAQRQFWESVAQWMYSDPFVNAFVTKFAEALQPRLEKIVAADGVLRTRGDALLVQDHSRYAIGPHTDAPHRLISFLFYMPQDDRLKDLGTSIYRARDPDFVCWGGPHHAFEPFEKVRTVEFLPNRLVAFPKTERSFHGVEPITRDHVERRLLINNVRVLNSVTH